MNRFAAAGLATLCLHLPMAEAQAQPSPSASAPVAPDAVFEPRIFRSGDGRTLPYRLLRPPESHSAPKSAKYPLVLFLHGAGERGADNSLQYLHGGAVMAASEFRRRYPAFVIVPQCPKDKRWVEVPWTDDAHTMLPEPSESLALAFDIIDAVRREFPVDDARLYGVGLSMGGFGVWDVLQRRPELLAAAVPICAGGDPAYADRFESTPVWAFHGDADNVVKVRRSREMIDALRAAGGRPVYTEYEGVGHDSWTQAYADPEGVISWMFEQRLDERGAKKKSE